MRKLVSTRLPESPPIRAISVWRQLRADVGHVAALAQLGEVAGRVDVEDLATDDEQGRRAWNVAEQRVGREVEDDVVAGERDGCRPVCLARRPGDRAVPFQSKFLAGVVRVVEHEIRAGAGAQRANGAVACRERFRHRARVVGDIDVQRAVLADKPRRERDRERRRPGALDARYAEGDEQSSRTGEQREANRSAHWALLSVAGTESTTVARRLSTRHAESVRKPVATVD